MLPLLEYQCKWAKSRQKRPLFQVSFENPFTQANVGGVERNDDERPRAYIVLKAGQSATANDIIAFMDGKVSAIKRITGGVIFVEAIPKNPSGKILRKVLRDQAREETQQTGVTAKL